MDNSKAYMLTFEWLESRDKNCSSELEQLEKELNKKRKKRK